MRLILQILISTKCRHVVLLKVKNIILISILLWGLNCGINAAMITFSDESKLEGKIKDARDDKIIIETEFGDIERMRSDIFSMTDLSSEETKILEKLKEGVIL